MPEPAPATVLIISSAAVEVQCMQGALESAGYSVKATSNGRTALDVIYAEPPQCMIIERGQTGPDGESLLDTLKHDHVYGHLPVLLLLDQAEPQAIDWGREMADDFLLRPFEEREFLARVRLCLARAQREMFANPLTGLPGNLTIMREAEARLALGKPFAMAYLDLDYFKPFNDKYGFTRGDEVLRMTARLMVNSLRSLDQEEVYVGHVGGDDFIFIVPSPLAVRACENFINNFDLIVPNFYDEEDRARGSIVSEDRQGNVCTFPLLSASIAVVDTANTDIHNIAELSSRAAEVKHFAKQLDGSNYILDRRR